MEVVALPPSDPMAVLMAAVTQLTQSVESLKQSVTKRKPPKDQVKCYNCGGLGHYRSQCKKENSTGTKQSGNQEGQQ